MFGLDLMVYTPKHLAERIEIGDWFLRDILREGKVLFESNIKVTVTLKVTVTCGTGAWKRLRFNSRY